MVFQQGSDRIKAGKGFLNKEARRKCIIAESLMHALIRHAVVGWGFRSLATEHKKEINSGTHSRHTNLEPIA